MSNEMQVIIPSVIAVSLIAIGVWSAIQKEKMSANKVIEEITKLKDFTLSQYHTIDGPITTVMAVDNNRRKLVFGYNTGKGIFTQMLSATDILESEVIEDNETITKTSRSSQLVGAAVGGILFGGIGAAVGAVTGSKTSKTMATKVGIRITIRDMSAPVREITFLNINVSKSSSQYSAAINKANHWHGVLSNIIKSAG